MIKGSSLFILGMWICRKGYLIVDDSGFLGVVLVEIYRAILA